MVMRPLPQLDPSAFTNLINFAPLAGAFDTYRTGVDAMKERQREDARKIELDQKWQGILNDQNAMSALAPAQAAALRGMPAEVGMPNLMKLYPNPAEDGLKRAQAGYYNAKAAEVSRPPVAAPPAVDPRAEWLKKAAAAGVKPIYETEDPTPNTPGDGGGGYPTTERDMVGAGSSAGGAAPMVRKQAAPPVARAPSAADDLITPEERALGITPEQKLTRMKIEYLSNGQKPKVGFMWALGPDGSLIQKLVREKETRKGDVSSETVTRAVGAINNAMNVLGGELDASGKPIGTGPNWVTKLISEKTEGRWSPKIYQAIQSGHYAAMQALYAQSGKSFSKTELENDLKLFKPTWSDTEEMSLFKLNSVKKLLLSLQEAKGANLSPEEIRTVYRSELEKAQGSIAAGANPRGQPAPPAPTRQPTQAGYPPARSTGQPQAGGDAKSRLYNKYGLE